MKKLQVFILLSISLLFISGCSSTDATSTSSQSENGVEEVEVASPDEPGIPFNLNDFILEITPTGKIDSAGGVEYSYIIQNNSDIPVREFSADVKFEFDDGQSMIESIYMDTTLMNQETIGSSGDTIYPEPASKIKTYQVIAYQIVDAEGISYEADLQLETVDIFDYGMSEVSEETPFEIEDFVIEITPTGEIDSAGGVVYSYEIQNNSSIPVKELNLDVKMTLEDGQSLVEDIWIDDTVMNGQSIGSSSETTYPVPPSKIKSYKLIGYQLMDKNDVSYDVDTQLNLVESYEY